MKRPTSRSSRPAAEIEALEQRIAPATLTVTTAADSGAGSLRAAITTAEQDAVADMIVFSIPGPGLHSIALLSALPKITQPLTINGASEPGFLDKPVVELTGAQAPGANGLLIASADVTINALTINHFTGNGILVSGGAGNVTIKGCFIGVDATGTVASPNGGQGISINAPNCTIGGAGAGERNVVAGNGQSGIYLNQTGTTVRGNYVGTNLLGSLQIPNGGNGIALLDGGNHIIGGSAAGQGNVISGNQGDDLLIFNSHGNTVAGNIIGLDLATKVELQSGADGIDIAGTSAGNTIGGTAAGARNVIAAHDENGAVGLRIGSSGTGNVVLGNIIGTNADGLDELENNTGIYVTAPGTVIGDLAGHGNFIAGNKGYGLEAYSAQNLQILGNQVGLYSGAGDALGNGGAGISIFGGTNVLVSGNTVSGNAGHGVIINNSLNALVQGNHIGTNAPGTAARPNSGTGLLVINCPGLLVGGAAAGQGNLLSGNGVYGLDINSAQPVTVLGNYIGTDVTGMGAIPDGDSGIRVVGGSGHHIGGAGAGEGNVVSGSFRGVQLATSGNVVRGNIIGLNADASNKLFDLPMSTGGAGVYIYAGSNNVIGGALAGEGNTIAGNMGNGVLVSGGGSGNQVLGNLIGTNAAGGSGLGNGGINPNVPSVVTEAPGTTIGGPGGARNIIASGSGRAIQVSNVPNVLIQGNWIGLAPDGTTKLGNLAGIALSGSGANNATILDNVIAGCSTFGIAGTDNSGHVIKGNRIGTNAAGTALVGNGQQGISLTRPTKVTIGGMGSGEGNLIAGSGIDAILLTGGTNVQILGNRLGTDAAGTVALPNQEGISINSSAASPVKTVLVSGNLIAGTKDNGINLSGAHTETRVQGNLLGVAANGTDPLPNFQGIAIGNGSGILLGGTAAEGNTVAFSKGAGVVLLGAETKDILFLSNTVRQNQGAGLVLTGVNGPLTLGDDAGGGNTIQGNQGAGVVLDGVQQVTLQGNIIAGNHGDGVLVKGTAQHNVVGGATVAAGNSITGNGGAGVAITAGSGTAVSHNAIAGNSGLAIDLGAAGATGNDAGDADSGANGLQNAPVLSGAARLPGGHFELLGGLESTPGSQFRLEFFAQVPGGTALFAGQTTVSTDASGQVAFQFETGTLPAGAQFTATATSLATGETSELGAFTAAPSVPTVKISGATVTEGNAGTGQAVFTVTLSEVPLLPVSFHYSTGAGSAHAGEDFTATSGLITFPAGSTALTANIPVPVLGDALPEAAENFVVKLSDGQNVFLLGDTGEATIFNDDTTLTISANHRMAQWRDADGDLVTLRSSKPVLSADDFVFAANGQGEQLLSLLLADDGAAAALTNLQFSARRDPLHPGGDGRVNVGQLQATGVDLGVVSISGDLGRVQAGDGVLNTPGVRSLTAGSMGFFGLATQGNGGNLHSEVAGALPSLFIRGDVAGADFHVSGQVGRVSIGGDLTGDGGDFSGSFRAEGKLGSFTVGGSLRAGSGNHSGVVSSGAALGRVTIKGSMAHGGQLASGGSLGIVSIGGDLAGSDGTHRVEITASGNMAGLTVGGSVSYAQVLAGWSPTLQPVNPDATVGQVRVANNWLASDLVAGINPGADGLFGAGGDDHAAAAVAPYADRANLFSRLAGIRIGGYVAGTPGQDGDHFAFAAQRIGALSVGNLAYVLKANAPDGFALGQTGEVTLEEV